MEMFRSRLDAVGLATAATTGSDEELDVLIDDVLAVADQLDDG
jgi:hypothetical protein